MEGSKIDDWDSDSDGDDNYGMSPKAKARREATRKKKAKLDHWDVRYFILLFLDLHDFLQKCIRMFNNIMSLRFVEKITNLSIHNQI